MTGDIRISSTSGTKRGSDLCSSYGDDDPEPPGEHRGELLSVSLWTAEPPNGMCISGIGALGLSGDGRL